MALFFVAYDTDDGNSLDCFIRAVSPEEALKIWADAVYAAFLEVHVPFTSITAEPADGQIFPVPDVEGLSEAVSWPHDSRKYFRLT